MNKQADEYRGTGTEPEEVEVSGGGISLRGLKTFDSFNNPVYRLYYGAMAGQWFAMSMQLVVRSLLIYRLTGSGAILGGMALAHAIPTLLLSLFGGAVADRVQKKYVLVAGQVGSAVISLVVALALTFGYLSKENPGSWWLLIATAALQGVIMGFMMPSRQAIIPEIVGERQVMNAISLNNMGMNTFRLVAPALAGFLVDAFNFAVIYYLTTIMYLLATLCAVFLPRTSKMTIRGSSALTDILEGLQYVRRETTVLIILVFTLIGIICGFPFQFLLPMITEDILKVGATGMGLLLSISGLGAILGSLVLASLPSRKRGGMMLLSSLIMGLALTGFAFSHWWYPSLVIAVFIGLGQTGVMTLGNTLVQYYADADYRGRVMSFHMMGIGFASLGTFFAGILSESVGVQWSIGGLAMILALVSIVGLLFIPRLRKLD
jgi:MFS family permease